MKYSALGTWLWNHRVSNPKFAAMMADHLKLPKFSARTVEKWRYGHSMPRGENMRAIKAITGITADEMMKQEEADSGGDERNIVD